LVKGEQVNKQSTQLWSVKWVARFVNYSADLWVLADSAEVAARKAKKFLRAQGNTSVVIKGVNSRGTIDVF
jgi:hypothetical protein